MKTTKLIFKLFLFSLVFVSCKDNGEIKEIEKEVIKEVPIEEIETFKEGVIISAEGSFGSKDGSISYVKDDFSIAANFIYKEINGAQLGGLIQSIAFNGDDAYIVLNDVNTIVIADRYTFVQKAVITDGLSNPRYMAFANGKGYVTNWGDGSDTTDDYVAIVDLSVNKVKETTISLDNGVERIIAKDNKLYVSHKGAFGSNNIISVIDATTDLKTATITVRDNPDEMLFSSTGELVVLSEGKPLAYGGAPDYAVTQNTTSAIQFIDLVDNTVSKELTFSENVRATFLAIDNGNIYYYGEGSKVYEIAESATTLVTEGVLVGNIYGMEVKEGLLYTLKYAFTNFSEFIVREVGDATPLYSSGVGLGASKIYFNE